LITFDDCHRRAVTLCTSDWPVYRHTVSATAATALVNPIGYQNLIAGIGGINASWMFVAAVLQPA